MKSIHKVILPNKRREYQRVAAYCRVSTKHDEQQDSLTMQKAYYETYIHEHENWILTDVYADQSTGRNIAKRSQFQLLMSDCRQGKIDLILTKSISRLGRDILDLLNCYRELKRLGVDVYFEIEKLYLSNSKSEQLITILSAISQEESLHKSQNIRWGIKRSFESENSKFRNRKCYGYCHDLDGKLIINDAEALIVKMIYNLRQSGYSLRQIAKELENQGIKSPRGSSRWGPESLNKILSNEKYVGKVLLQKTIVENYYDGKQRKNLGQECQYLISEHHPPIIEKDLFERVQLHKKNYCD